MHRLEVPAVIDSLQQVNAHVRALAAEAGLDPTRTYHLRLATEELLTNVIRHGYGPMRPDGRVVIESAVSAEDVWIRIIDTAARFDPFTVPNPTGLDQPLQNRVPGALGLYLVRQVVDVATHDYVDGTNRTTVVMRRARRDSDRRNGDVRNGTDRERV